jgi:lipopolysaccharide export system permease protein
VKEFLRLFLLCAAGGTVLYMIIDLFDRITIFIRNGATAGWIALFLVNKIPLIIYQITPAAMLLAVILALGIMSRHNEIIALRTAGIPVMRIAYPFVVISALVGVGIFFFNEYIVSPTYARHEHMSRTLVEGKIPFKWLVAGKYWFKGPGGIYEIGPFIPATEELYGITYFEIARPFRLARRVDAAKATWQGEQWVFEDVVERMFLPGNEVRTVHKDRMTLGLRESPAEFQSMAKHTEEFPYYKLREIIREIEAEGYDSTPYRVEMYRKISFPALNVITALLGIPFALRLPKTGGLAAAVGISLVLGFLFWVLFAVTLSFGKTGVIPPLISAWAANILFLGLGMYLLLRVEAKAIT